jgi:hypothetical protein
MMTLRTTSSAAVGFLLFVSFAAFGCGTTGSTETGGREAAPETPARFSYAPFDATYLIASHTSQEQDFGGQVNASEFAMHWYLSVVNSASGLTLTIDSAPKITGIAQGVSQSDLDQAAGMVFTGTLSPEGRISDFGGGDTSSEFTQQLAQSVERFLPRVPAGGAAAGQTWVDTLETSTGSGGLEINVQLITRSQAQSWVEHEGGQALLVTTTTDYSMSGGGTQMGSEIDIDGTGVRHGTVYLGADGQFLGGISADTANLTATVAAMGAIIPIFQARHDTVAVAR